MNTKSLNFIATFVLALVLSFIMPWWSVMLAAFATALLFTLKGVSSFFVPFFSILILWAGYSFLLSSPNDFTLARKIAVLLPLKGNPYLLILLAGLIGGLAAGIAGIFGTQCRLMFKKK